MDFLSLYHSLCSVFLLIMLIYLIYLMTRL